MKEIWAVSGQSGFLGSHLVERLGQKDQQLVRIERDGCVPLGATYIIDLASYGNLSHQKDIRQIYEANVMRALNVIETATEAQAIIMTSTSSVLLKTQTPYSMSKRSLEKVAQYYATKYARPIVVVRPSSVTGVGEQKEHLIPTLIRSCLEGTGMPFVGYPTHDFIDVQDFIDGLLVVKDNIEMLKGEVINISSGVSYTNKEVKDMVEKVTRKKANINKIHNMREYDSNRWIVRNDKMLVLGWKPKKLLVQSIKEMVRDYGK